MYLLFFIIHIAYILKRSPFHQYWPAEEQCCFNSTPDPFNGQTVDFILKPPKVIESTTYVKKANLATAQQGKSGHM